MFCLLAVLVVVLVGCSSGKNTATTRWWQAFNTRYNVYYNGAQAYIEGSLEKETGNQDNFTEMIPLYTVGNKSSRDLGKTNFDKAIEKAEKAIKLHSIKKRPEWNKNRRKTAKDIEWLHRREYNPFLWKAWLLLGRAQFHKGDFDAAASTFAYMSRIYATQPAIYGRARAWLAKAYVENDLLYDAEDVIRNMQRDSIHWSAQKEWDYTYADYYIHTGDYEQAVKYLRRVIRHEMRRKQKAREYYLLGQLETALGHNAEAAKAYRRVPRLNPPYELAFNARIALSEVLAASQSRQMIRKLKRMARADNNKDYLDQVYYALGNIYLAEKDTAEAIRQYELGNRKATRRGVEKGVLLLRLGGLYWERHQWSDARRCYADALGLLDKERKDYAQLTERSKVLDKLTPYTEAVHLQDSLQALAKMSEKDRNAAIDRVIEALKKKEKEQRDSVAEALNQQNQQQNGGMGNINANKNTTTNVQQGGTWYFYNPMAVQQGKQQFQRIWGKRENVDNWQRNNKTVVAGLDQMGDQPYTDEQRDSIARAQEVADSLEQIAGKAENDPHQREYYLKQIPFTEEQVAASNAIIMDGLYNSGVIFKDELDYLDEAEKTLRRLTDDYPSYEHMDNAFYHLFLLYSRKGETAVADSYVRKLKESWPESEWTRVLTDPYFRENAVAGVHLEDSLYAATYAAFKADRLSEVESNTKLSATRFPQGANRDKFIFIGGLSALNSGNADACLQAMEQVVKDYPESPVAEMAGMIVNGVREGRMLRGGSFDIGDVWKRRTAVLADSDSIQARTFSNERNTPFEFMLVYMPDSVNENKLLYEMARYNFTSYLVRDFDISIEDDGALHRMRVSGFQSYDEALQYARSLYQQEHVRQLTAKARPVIISEENLPLLGTNFSYDEYQDYYNRHFAPLTITPFRLLTEPAEVTTQSGKATEDAGGGQPAIQEGTVIVPAEPTATEMDTYLQENYDMPATPQDNAQPQQGTTVIPTDTPVSAPQEGTVIPLETATPQGNAQPQQGTTVIPTDTPVPAPQEGTVIPSETATPQSNAQPQQGTTVIPIDTPEAAPQEGTVIPSETVTPQDNTQPQQGTTVVPADTPAVRKRQSTDTPQTPVQERNRMSDDGVTIYFNDTEDVPPSTGRPATPAKSADTPQKEDKPKQQSYDLEDEYYDLDGF